MNLKELKEELARVMVQAFMFHKIANIEKLIDPLADSRCSFSEEEMNEWEKHYPKLNYLLRALS